jgi:hypothetical protein
LLLDGVFRVEVDAERQPSPDSPCSVSTTPGGPLELHTPRCMQGLDSVRVGQAVPEQLRAALDTERAAIERYVQVLASLPMNDS